MQRLKQLDSLRGIAALSVLFHHYFYIIPSLYDRTVPDHLWEKIIKFTPLHIFWAGSESVMFFFVLSGFVLALPFLQGKKVTYKKYISKRILRIYLPYIVSVIVALLAAKLFYSGSEMPELSVWFNSKWDDKLTIGFLLQSVALIFSFNNGEYNPVLWSLVQEMRISLIFPLIMLFVMKYSWKRTLPCAMLISFFGYSVDFILNRYGLHNDYFLTLHYLLMFVVGALLAKHRYEIIGFFEKLSGLKIVGFIVAAILTYTYSWWFLPQNNILHFRLINEWVSTVGVILIISFAISYNGFKKVLEIRPLHYLGEISYSLYLYHAISLLTFVNLLYGKVQLPLIMLIALVVSLALSSISYHFIETKSIQLGRSFSITRNREIEKPA